MLTLAPRRARALALIGIIALVLAGCASPPTEQPAAESGTAARPLRVVVTYSILGDLVQQVAGDMVDLTTLAGAGSDPHVYEPSPRDSASLAEADILFENGLEFESWIDDLYAAAGSQATRVAVTAQISPLPISEEGHAEGEEGHAEGEEEHAEGEDGHAEGEEEHAEGEDGHGHGEYDPHVWQDPNNVVAMVESISAALAAADPANAASYQSNAAAYQAQLKELDAWIAAEVGRLPAEQRKLVTSHDTFGYFAQRYGFTIVGTALGSTTAESDPSAGAIAALVDEIRAAGVPAIFAESASNPALMETIAREAGVKLAAPLYTDALSEPGSPGASYLEMMRYNVTTIVAALAG